MLYDIVFLLILCFAVIGGFRRGFVKTLLALCAFVLAALVAAALSQCLCEVVYDSFLRPYIVNTVEESMQSLSQKEGFEVAETAVLAIPVVLLGVLDHFGYSAPRLTEYLTTSQENGTYSLSQVVSDLVRGPASGIIALVLFIIFFLLFLLVFLLILPRFGKKIRIPLVSLADSLIGAALGFVEGIIIVFILATLLWISVPFLPDGVSVLSSDYIFSSKVISFVCTKELGLLIHNITYKINELKEFAI